MNDYMLLMHIDGGNAEKDWESYIAGLNKSGNFQGGSAIGGGMCVSKSGAASAITEHLSGYMRIQADSFEHARELVIGNPAYEGGGTVEIRELPKS